MNEQIIHEPGIYLGLDADRYHADPALGSTSIKQLASKPWMWQLEKLRGPGEEKITEPMKFGAAFHCYVLEGEEEFERRYKIKPAPEDFGVPGRDVLVTVDHFKEFLIKNNQPASGLKRKEDFVRAVCNYLSQSLDLDGNAPVIFDRELEKFWAESRVADEYALTKRQLQEVRDGIYMMRQHSIIREIMDVNRLIGGVAEMSVFYEHQGVRCKNRYDYPLPPAPGRDHAMINDLKIFSNFRGGNSESAAADTIYRMGYDLQAIHYLTGYEYGKQLFSEGRVFGREPRENFLRDFFSAEKVRWAWIMLKRDEGFIPVIPWFERDTEAYHRDLFWQATERAYESAFQNLSYYREAYGPDRLWAPPEDVPPRVDFTFMPSWNRGY